MSNKGFIATRTLMALFIVMLYLPLMVNVLLYVSQIDSRYDLLNDEISLVQLRRILLLSYDIKISNSSISFIYGGNTRYLSMINGRLVLTPGYQMFLDKVEGLHFEQKEGLIYLIYDKDEKEYEAIIAKSEGLSVDDFRDCDDDSDEFDGSE